MGTTLAPEILKALHGIGSKAATLNKLKVSRRNWTIFKRHYGFDDGTSWSLGKLAEHYRLSRQRIGQIVKVVEDRLRAHARTRT